MKISELAAAQNNQNNLAVIINNGGGGDRPVGEYQQFPVGSKLCINGTSVTNANQGIDVGLNDMKIVQEKVQGSQATWVRIVADSTMGKYATSLKQLSHNTIPFGVSVEKWQEVLAEHPDLKQRSTKEILTRDLVAQPLVLKERFEVDRNDGSHASIEVWV